jgi:hypothetical protein
MPSTIETLRALYGAWRLARLDKGGMAYFDVSERGFWTSFFAALIVAPLYALFLYLRFASGLENAPVGRFVPIKAIAYALSWIAFPLAMATYTRLVGCWPRYVAFMVAYNWSSVLQNGLYLGVVILATLKVLPTTAANFLGVVAFGLVIAYSWVVARIALRTTGMVATGVVALDFFLGLAINAISDRMLR